MRAPVVSGAASYLLYRHPGWTPDQVKGALMLTASPGTDASSFACGVGETRADSAAKVWGPPNPNAALDQFVVTPPDGGPPRFDVDAWREAASSDDGDDDDTLTASLSKTWTSVKEFGRAALGEPGPLQSLARREFAHTIHCYSLADMASTEAMTGC